MFAHTSGKYDVPRSGRVLSLDKQIQCPGALVFPRMGKSAPAQKCTHTKTQPLPGGTGGKTLSVGDVLA